MAEACSSELLLPVPFSILGNASRPILFLQLLGSVAAVVGGGVSVALLHRHRRIQRQRLLHDRRIDLWLDEREAERLDRIAFLEHSGEQCDPSDTDSIRFNMDEILDLWKEAHRLGCTNAAILHELMVDQLRKELPACLSHVAAGNWRYERPLGKWVEFVYQIQAQKPLGSVWTKAADTNSKLRNRNRKHLFTIMILSSRYRILGLGLTTLITYVSDRLDTAVTETYTQWMECFVNYEPHSTILKWSTINLLLCISTAAISYVVEKTSSVLVAGFKKETDAKLYQALAKMDMDFFDTYTDKEINEIVDLTTELSEADNKMHMQVKSLIRLSSKLSTLVRVNKRLTAALFGLCGVYAAIDHVVNWFTRVSQEDEWLDPILAIECNGEDEASPTPTDQDSPTTVGPPAVSSAGSCSTTTTTTNVPIPHNLDMLTVLHNVKVLRTLGVERLLMQDLLTNNRDAEQDTGHSNVMAALVDCTGSWALSGVRLWGVWHAAWLVQQKVVDYPLAQLNTLVSQAFMAFQEIRLLNFRWIDEFAADAALLLQILEWSPKIETESGISPPDFKGEIEFRDVHFAYPSAPETAVLRGLSFKASPGNFVGLVGPSGSGKSTVLQLLQRLYDPTQGQILLDGVEMQAYNPRWLRSQIAVVSQTVALFDLSIEDNIRLGNPTATREEVIDAARRACAYEFIMRLPSGFSTQLASCQLSNGQRQSLAIARALVATKAKILLLDEATASLDTVAEREVQAALAQVRQGKTCFTITHRFPTLQDANQIVVLQKGVCVESGTHDRLIGLKGAYYGMAHSDADHLTIPTVVEPPVLKSPKSPKQVTFEGAKVCESDSEGAQDSDEETQAKKKQLTFASNLAPLSPIPSRPSQIGGGGPAAGLHHAAASFRNMAGSGNTELAAFSREFYGISRRLQSLNIHTNSMLYKREVRVAVEQIIAQMQDVVMRMGRQVKQSSAAASTTTNPTSSVHPHPTTARQRMQSVKAVLAASQAFRSFHHKKKDTSSGGDSSTAVSPSPRWRRLGRSNTVFAPKTSSAAILLPSEEEVDPMEHQNLPDHGDAEADGSLAQVTSSPTSSSSAARSPSSFASFALRRRSDSSVLSTRRSGASEL